MADLKKVIRQEYLKCAKDPVHFMRKYCYIQHPQRGRIQFNLYPFQEKVLTLFRDNPYSIVLKSRQLGLSTLSAGYSLWLMIFHKDKNILCIATKQETAKNMVTKVKFMFENLTPNRTSPTDPKSHPKSMADASAELSEEVLRRLLAREELLRRLHLFTTPTFYKL